jgi:hypothetical protein
MIQPKLTAFRIFVKLIIHCFTIACPYATQRFNDKRYAPPQTGTHRLPGSAYRPILIPVHPIGK